jgi:hypothetical protein
METIFDQYGKVRRDIDENEIADLPAATRDALMAVLDAAIKSEDADQEAIAAESAMRCAARNVADKLTVHRGLAPIRSFHDEWRETVAKLPPKPVDRGMTEAAAAAAQEVERANVLLDECRSDAYRLQRNRLSCRQAFADAAAAWSLVAGTPKTTADLVRANVQRETVHQLGILNGTIVPAAVVCNVPPSQLDSVLRSGSRGSSANLGYRRPTRPVPPR